MKYTTIKTIRRIKIFIIILVVVMCSCFYTRSISADETKIIRVGFPNVSGFTEKKDGSYTGYAYEYLREIAIYTGWEYEFVEKSLGELMDDLKEGHIDILGGMIKNEKTMEIYDFPKYDSGNTYTTLSVLNDNSFDESKYVVLDGIKVGYFETDKASKNSFIKFCEDNNIKDYELKAYPYEAGKELLLEKIESGEIDAIIQGDLSVDSRDEVITKFGGIPQYFATTKGNSEVISGLNAAIYKIKENNPYFNKNLYHKYFESNDYNYLIFTKEEENYINQMQPIKAAYIDNYIPVHYYDENTKKPKGIFIDAMNLISQRARFEFDFVRVETYEEAYELIKNGQADVIIGAINDYLIADENNFILTKSYLNFERLKVVNKKAKRDIPIVALPINHGPINLSGEYEIKYYEDIEQCLIAVKEGIADVTYGNSYSITNYIATGYYNNLTVISDIDNIEIAMGISKAKDLMFQRILHKAVYSLSDKDIQNIVQNNTLNIKHSVSVKEFLFENLELFIIITILVLGIICTLIYIIVKMRFDKIREDKKRLFEKTQIDSLTGVYNREACEQGVREYLKEKDRLLYYAFIIIDIDYFKQINDRFGHKIGDQLLIEFSKLLKESFSDKDIISRLGGDEFIIFIRDIHENNKKNIDQKLKALCAAMDKEVEYNGSTQKISLSLGCIMTMENIDFNKLYTMADEVLYEVKHNGKNGYRIKEVN